MTGIPPEVNRQVAGAIKSAFNEEKLWREIRTRTGENLENEIPQHLNLTDQIFELLDWLGKRGRTVEILEHLNEAVPGNTRLQAATAAYKEAEQQARDRGIEPGSDLLPSASRQATASLSARTGSGNGGFRAPPWAWMALGALILIIGAVILFGGDDEPAATAEPMEYGDDVTLDVLYDDCEFGDLSACDTLFDVSAEDSEYEDFGWTCGDRLPGGFNESCVADLEQ